MSDYGGKFENAEKCEEADIIAYLHISINHAHTVIFFSILLFPYYLNIHVYNIWRYVPIHTQMLYIFFTQSLQLPGYR